MAIPPSLFDTHPVLHGEHFIPLANPDGPGTVPTNIIPACQGCNSEKSDQDPYIWVIKRFGRKKGTEILRKIETYFASLMEKVED